MKVVVDSSIIIDYLRGGRKWDDFIGSVERDTQLFLPTVVIFELFSGNSTREKRKLQEMIAFISEFQRIDLNEDIAKVAGELFRDTKIKIQAADCIIAASALQVNAQVVSLNQKHFAQISNINLYPLS